MHQACARILPASIRPVTIVSIVDHETRWRVGKWAFSGFARYHAAETPLPQVWWRLPHPCMKIGFTRFWAPVTLGMCATGRETIRLCGNSFIQQNTARQGQWQRRWRWQVTRTSSSATIRVVQAHIDLCISVWVPRARQPLPPSKQGCRSGDCVCNALWKGRRENSCRCVLCRSPVQRTE